MVRAVLAERFGLVAHNEVRERPVYALTTARPDRPAGRRPASAADSDCAEAMRRMVAPVPGPRPPGPPPCSFGGGPGRIQGNVVTLAMFANMLAGTVGRPVIDRTGVPGHFNITLEYTPEAGITGFRHRRACRPGAAAAERRAFTLHGAAGAARAEARIDARARGRARDRQGVAADGELEGLKASRLTGRYFASRGGPGCERAVPVAVLRCRAGWSARSARNRLAAAGQIQPQPAGARVARHRHRVHRLHSGAVPLGQLHVERDGVNRDVTGGAAATVSPRKLPIHTFDRRGAPGR